jgi:hypothetical protein
MRKKIASVATLVAVVLAPTLVAAEGPSLTPVACASSASPVKMTSRVPASASSAKIYFKAAGQQLEYYVDTRRAADGSMWAFIPAPEVTTRSFSYRVVYLDARGVQTSSPLMTATTAASCPAPSFSADEQRAAANMVVGLTAAGQSAVPTGFQCRGVVSYISAAGEMHQNDECRRLLALGPAGSGATGAGATGAGATGAGVTGAGATGAGAGASATAVGAGLSTGTIIALTAAGLGAGAIIYNNSHHNNNQVSPSRP